LEQQRLANENQQEQQFSSSAATFSNSGNTFDVLTGNVDIPSSENLSSITTIKFSEANAGQSLTIGSSITFSSLNNGSGTITGTLSNSNVDDEVRILGTRNFQDVTFSNIAFLDFGSATSQEKLVVDAETSLVSNSNRTVITGFKTGTDNNADIFDYASNLKAGAGTTRNSGTDLGVVSLTSLSDVAANAISTNTSGVLAFNYTEAELGANLNLFGSDLSTIINDVVQTLNSSASTKSGDGAFAQGGSATDMLLIFFENAASGPDTTQDAGIFRYQEGGSDTFISSEISLVAVFEGVTAFDTANIV